LALAAVAGNVAADAYNFVFTPTAVGVRAFLPPLVTPAVDSHHQQLRSIGRAVGVMTFAVGLALAVTATDHAPAQCLAPTLNLLAVQVPAPIPVQGLGRLVEAPARRFPTNTLRRMRPAIAFRGQGPVTVLRGKKSRRRRGSDRAAFRPPPPRRGTSPPDGSSAFPGRPTPTRTAGSVPPLRPGRCLPTRPALPGSSGSPPA